MSEDDINNKEFFKTHIQPESEEGINTFSLARVLFFLLSLLLIFMTRHSPLIIEMFIKRRPRKYPRIWQIIKINANFNYSNKLTLN